LEEDRLELLAVKPALVQADKKSNVVGQSKSPLVSIGGAANDQHQQPQQPQEQQPQAEPQPQETQQPDQQQQQQPQQEQQPEVNAGSPVEEQQPQGSAADEVSGEAPVEQQPEVNAGSPVEEQQPQGSAVDEVSGEAPVEQQPEGNAGIPVEEQQPQGSAADEVSGEAPVEQQASEADVVGDAATSTAVESQQPQESVPTLPAEVRHNSSTITSDWREEYPRGAEPASDVARPRWHYAVGFGLVLLALMAATRLRG